MAAAVNEGDHSGEVDSEQRLLDPREDALPACPATERQRLLAALRYLRKPPKTPANTPFTHIAIT